MDFSPCNIFLNLSLEYLTLEIVSDKSVSSNILMSLLALLHHIPIAGNINIYTAIASYKIIVAIIGYWLV